MKKLLFLASLSVLTGAVAVRADDADDQYVAIIHRMADADSLNEDGQKAQALANYRDAQFVLKKFQSAHPDWNSALLSYRRKYLSEKISQISASLPSTEQTIAPAKETTEPTAAIVAGTSSPKVAVVAEDQVPDLMKRIQQMEEERAALQASLKEAQAAKQAAVNPQELATATESIEALKKENEVLKAGLDQTKKTAGAANSAALKKARQSLQDATAKLDKLAENNASLTSEREALQARIKSFEQQIGQLKGKEVTLSQGTQPSKELTDARLQIASLQSERKALAAEKEALEIKVKHQERILNVPAY